MVFELTAGIAAICGAVHRFGKLGYIPAYGYDRANQWPAGLKLLLMIMSIGTVGIIGKFENFESGFLFGLVFIGSWKLSEEALEFIVDCWEGLRT